MAEQDESRESSGGTGPLAYFLYGLIELVAVAWAIETLHNRFALGWTLAYLVAINLVAFAFYVYDKVFVNLLNALRMRVPELQLVCGLAVPGGWGGALAAMALTGHKMGRDSKDFRRMLVTGGATIFTLVAALLLVIPARPMVSFEKADALIAQLVTLVMSGFRAALEAVKAL